MYRSQVNIFKKLMLNNLFFVKKSTNFALYFTNITLLTFDSFGLSELVLSALSDLNFVQATDIQEKALPILLEQDCDFIGLAQTGTGKTAAYGLPLLEKIDAQVKAPQAIILSPTRELCLQICTELQKFGKNIRNLHIVPVYGGANIQEQIRELKKGPQIIVATPGRMIDHLKRGTAGLTDIRYVVLDEADEMLNMGFREDLDEILSFTSVDKFVWLFSATMPDEIRRIVHTYMDSPKEVSIGRKNTSAANIEHLYIQTDRDLRYEVLKRVLDYYPDVYGMIFTRTKTDAQEIGEQLARDGYNADSLHGDLSQALRDKVMTRFRERTIQILVATDVAARGIDVEDITHVIHYGLPDDVESYIHRSGRTARAGKTGVSLSIVFGKDKMKLKEVEKKIQKEIPKILIPTPKEIIEKRMLYFFESMKTTVVDDTLIHDYLPAIHKQLESMDRDEIIMRFSYLEFSRFATYYQNAQDLNKLSRDRKDSKDGKSDSKFDDKRMFINVGKKDGFSKMELLDILAEETGLPRKCINRISLGDTFSFFEVPARDVEKVIRNLKGLYFGKRSVHVELASENGSSDKKSDRPRKDKPKVFNRKRD